MNMTTGEMLQAISLLVIATAFIVAWAIEARHNRDALEAHEKREALKFEEIVDALRDHSRSFSKYARENQQEHEKLNRSIGRLEGKICAPSSKGG